MTQPTENATPEDTPPGDQLLPELTSDVLSDTAMHLKLYDVLVALNAKMDALAGAQATDRGLLAAQARVSLEVKQLLDEFIPVLRKWTESRAGRLLGGRR